MYEYQQIIYRLKQGQSYRAIAREGLASRPTVKQIRHLAAQYGWLEPGTELPDAATRQSVFEGPKPSKQAPSAESYHDLMTQWVHQGVQARVIHQHLVNDYGFEGHYTAVQRYVQKLKANLHLEEKLTVPLAFQPGEAAQVDFGQGPGLYDERYQRTIKTWFFVMTLCWSRHQYAELVTAQDVETWLNCHQNAFQWLNGVPAHHRQPQMRYHQSVL